MLSKTARPLISAGHNRPPERVRRASFPAKPSASASSLDSSTVSLLPGYLNSQESQSSNQAETHQSNGRKASLTILCSPPPPRYQLLDIEALRPIFRAPRVPVGPHCRTEPNYPRERVTVAASDKVRA